MKSPQFNYIVSLFLIIFVFSCSSTKQLNSKNTAATLFESELHIDRKHSKNPFFEETDKEEKWVDSIYNQMSFEEKVGQLFMVAAYSNKDSIHVNSIDKLVKELYTKYKIIRTTTGFNYYIDSTYQGNGLSLPNNNVTYNNETVIVNLYQINAL
jgi:hypothetical protein